MKKRQRRRLLPAALILCVVLVLLYASSVLSDYRGSYSGELKQVTILEGSSTADIAAALKEQGIIKNPLWFRVFSKICGNDGSFHQGTYMIKEKAGYQELY